MDNIQTANTAIDAGNAVLSGNFIGAITGAIGGIVDSLTGPSQADKDRKAIVDNFIKLYETDLNTFFNAIYASEIYKANLVNRKTSKSYNSEIYYFIKTISEYYYIALRDNSQSKTVGSIAVADCLGQSPNNYNRIQVVKDIYTAMIEEYKIINKISDYNTGDKTDKDNPNNDKNPDYKANVINSDKTYLYIGIVIVVIAIIIFKFK